MKQYIGTKIIHAKPANRSETEPGYFVKYQDGYESWSPKEAFEEAYRECSAMTFGMALEALKKGLKVSRSGWNGVGLWLELQRPDAHSKMTLPYIFINYPDNARTTPGARCPWLASQTDVMAEDWQIV